MIKTVQEEMIIICWMMVLFELILMIQMTTKIDNDYNEKSLQRLTMMIMKKGIQYRTEG